MQTGFVRAQNKEIVDHKGNVFLLRGVGLGNWLLPEGYMWKFYTKYDRPRRINDFIESLIGKPETAEFWRLFRQRYITEADIIRIKQEGFNSIRLPMHYDQLEWIDSVISWCEKHKIYVILDLHGAPGGQTGTNIDDSENDLPELFMDKNYQDQTVKLWHSLAKKYKDNPWIAGYDLLNEPLPNWFSQYNHLLMPLYKRIIKAIREVDTNHMIILEGLHWTTDWKVFEELEAEPLDHNLMLEFHKYWSNADVESLEPYLKLREKLNLPIFMGEGGENNIAWYTGVFRMYDDLNISWNFWTWKKLDTKNSPCSIIKPEGWDLFVDTIDGKSKPDKEKAELILNTYLDHIRIENCDYNQNVIRSILRQAPLKIPAEYYDYEGIDHSFHIEHKHHNNGLRSQDYSELKMKYHDGELNYKHYGGEDDKDNEEVVLVINEGEWFNYSFNTLVDNDWVISLNIFSSTQECKFDLYLDGTVYHTKSFKVTLKKGSYTLRIGCILGSIVLDAIDIDSPRLLPSF